MWQGDSGEPNEFCGFSSPLYQIYLGAAIPVAKLTNPPPLASRQTAPRSVWGNPVG